MESKACLPNCLYSWLGPKLVCLTAPIPNRPYSCPFLDLVSLAAFWDCIRTSHPRSHRHISGMAEVLEEASSFKLFGALIVREHRRAQEEEAAVVQPSATAAEEARRVAGLPCPRCKSEETKFCYFNNYNVNQPRHLCKACRRYWTAGGTLRDVPAKATTRSAWPRQAQGRVNQGDLNFAGS